MGDMMPKNADITAGAVPLIGLWRGDLLESAHLGHAVICDAQGDVVASWGDSDALIYPRSSCKMIQALPLVETGAGRDLTAAHLALACASHQGAAIHVQRVDRWLADMDMTETDLRCGPQEPADRAERDRLACTGDASCQLHNNCSGKHAGFLMQNRHLRGDADYVDPAHPVQRAVRAAFEEVTEAPAPTYGIDGCSAPNFATPLRALAGAMGRFAGAREDGDARARAMVALRQAMVAHPDLVAGEGRACTELMRAMGGQVAIKTGAEAVFVAILPKQGLGIALKIADGSVRASEAAIAAMLVQLGVLAADHPATLRFLGPQTNRRGIVTGHVGPMPGFAGA